jgi:hypothetical protein
MKRFAATVFCLAALVGCKDEQRLGYLELTGRMFIFNPRVASATYVVTFNLLKDVPNDSRVLVTFENPAGGPALTKERRILPGEAKLGVESDNLQCIKKDRRYNFTAVLIDPSGKELQKIESSIKSTLDQSIMPEAPLSDGPTFIPNKDLKKGPDGKFIRTKPLNCPA